MSVAVTPGPPQAGASQKPQPLTHTEMAWSALLVLVGFVLIFGVLSWFAVSGDGELKSKVTEISEPVGDEAGTKTTTTTEFSDTLVIFALTTGAALLLAGAFYGRLRELKLGVLTLGLGELAPETKAAIAEKTREKIERGTTDPDQQRILAEAAQALAAERVRSAYWGVIPSPPDAYLERVVEEAATDVLSAAGTAAK